MPLHPRSRLALLLLATLPSSGAAQAARISETIRVIATYPFSEPDRVPILARDERLYPYHAFAGYAASSVPRPWRVVTLENELIRVDVLPEVGGKVWGAVVKRSGHEFIYRNEVLKFRNIALRGPWTSGGIEFNFGVVGHTPSTATPVDYVTLRNDDGSVSCVVGMMDLPSRTQWRVEIRLAPGRAAFETRVLWYNPTPLVQPYYNWMTAAAPARDDLVMTIPGDAYLGHPGEPHPWPVDSLGRRLDAYAANAFGGNKSYHVVGERADFFGGYYRDADRGFGHWAPYDEMPGQKLWLWALSREGGIWEDLLTDTDGQYVEYQAGRQLVQYTPTGAVNPISQAGFAPGTTDHWEDTWYPLEGLGGLTAASRLGAIHVDTSAGRLTISAEAFQATTDTLTVTGPAGVLLRAAVRFDPLSPRRWTVDLPHGAAFRVALPALEIEHASDPAERRLGRPWTTPPAVTAQIPEADRLATEARQQALGRRYPEARLLYAKALEREPWHRGALLGMAELELRRGRYAEGLALVRRLQSLDAYDADVNFLAGTLHHVLEHDADALDALGWAARSPLYRVTASVQMAEIELSRGKLAEARRHATEAIDFDRRNLPAREILMMIADRTGDRAASDSLATAMLAIDPLHHFVAAERALHGPSALATVRSSLGGEYPHQVVLELAIDMARRGATDDAVALLSVSDDPMALAWTAWLTRQPVLGPARLDLVFPYRPETIDALRWVADHNPHWSWHYLYALNLWACDRADDAADVLDGFRDIDYAPAVAARALLLDQVRGNDPVPELRRAVALEPADRLLRVLLVQQLQRRSMWQPALDAAQAGRTAFPGDFNLDLLAVGSLVQLGRGADALAILEATHVLPSENARDSHRLWVQANTLVALDALGRRDLARARAHLQSALDWPESLGQGKPYLPEERLTRLLLGAAAERSGDRAAARAAWEAVLGGGEPPTPALSLVVAIARSRRDGAPLPARPTTGFDDLDGRLVLRAMDLFQ